MPKEIDFRSFERIIDLKESIGSNSFKNLTKLKKFSLYNNRIEEIDVRVFEMILSNIKDLRLFKKYTASINKSIELIIDCTNDMLM